MKKEEAYGLAEKMFEGTNILKAKELIDLLLNQKVFVQDLGFYGCSVVIAKNKEEAIKEMENGHEEYDKREPIMEFDIDGFKWFNVGELS